jgi:glycosyltransferase involved in cell wall biosynthesis
MKKNKRVFILTAQFPPDTIVGGIRLFRLAKVLGRSGYSIVVITKKNEAEAAKNYEYLKQLSPGTEIHYIRTNKTITVIKGELNTSCEDKKKHVFPKIIRRIRGNFIEILDKITIPDIGLFNVPWYVIKAILLYDDKFDNFLLSSSPPHSIHVAGWICSKLRKYSSWTVDFRDPWDMGPQKNHSPIVNPIESFFKNTIVMQSDRIISSTTSFTNDLVYEYPKLHKKFHTITNSYDHECIPLSFKKSDEKFVVIYPGIFYHEKNPYGIFRAIHDWFISMTKEEEELYKSKIIIELIGSRTRFLETLINDLNLNANVKFSDRISQSEVYQKIKNADLGLISTGFSERKGCLPAKIFDYLGCRIPIIALAPEGEVTDLIYNTKSGYVIKENELSTIRSIFKSEIDYKFYNGKRINSILFENIEHYESSNLMARMVLIIDANCGTK